MRIIVFPGRKHSLQNRNFTLLTRMTKVERLSKAQLQVSGYLDIMAGFVVHPHLQHLDRARRPPDPRIP